MSETVTSVVPSDLADEIQALIQKSGGRLTKSSLIREALEHYVGQRAEPEVNLETLAEDPDKPPDHDLTEQFRASFVEVMDFVPTISTRGETGQITSAHNKDTLRALDILLALPGIRQKTRADLVRAFVHHGLKAVDQMMTLDHPSWRVAMVAARQREALERQLSISEDIYAGALALRDSMWLSIERGVLDTAVGLWRGYYDDALLMPEPEQEIMLKVLREMPVARRVAWLSRDTELLPEEFVPEQVEPTYGVVDETGLPIPPQLKIKRELAAAYGRGYYRGRQGGPPNERILLTEGEYE